MVITCMPIAGYPDNFKLMIHYKRLKLKLCRSFSRSGPKSLSWSRSGSEYLHGSWSRSSFLYMSRSRLESVSGGPR